MTEKLIKSLQHFDEEVQKHRGGLILAQSALETAYSYREELAAKLRHAEENIKQKQVEFFKQVQLVNGSVDLLKQEVIKYADSLIVTNEKQH